MIKVCFNTMLTGMVGLTKNWNSMGVEDRS